MNSLQIISFIGTYSFNLLSITVFLLPAVIFYKTNIKIKFFTTIFLFICLLSNHFLGNLKIKDDSESIKNLDFTIKIISPKIEINRFLEYEDPEKSIKELIKNYSEHKKFAIKRAEKLNIKNYSKSHLHIINKIE